jgi:hypothetical protein
MFASVVHGGEFAAAHARGVDGVREIARIVRDWVNKSR